MSHADARAEIEAAIPHREPFLFVDRVLGRGEPAGSWIETAWRVPPDADFLRGHYPGNPITPGVVLAEHCFQSAALLVSGALGGFSEDDGVPVLAKVEGARFRRMVRPGDEITTRVELVERLGPAWILAARVRDAAGAKVMDARFVLSATEAMRRVAPGAGAPG